jgi:exonuclease-1
LKPATNEVHLRHYEGQTAAVDVMTWLYKGAYSCATELGLGQETLNFLAYPIKMIQLVRSYKIKPICVFDGMHLKAKATTEKNRQENKAANKELAMQMAEKGNKDGAKKYFTRSLVLRSKMIDLFVDILHALKIEVVVAPYEADAQLAYLVKEGIANFAISEDSDLIAYGCPRLLMKLNWAGYGQMFSWDAFHARKTTDKNLAVVQGLGRAEFIQACIMGGCEYLPSIQQVGLKVALRLFHKHKALDEVVGSLQKNKAFKDRVPENYLEAVKRVQALFFYQTVFDTRTGELTSLEPMPEQILRDLDPEFLGDRSVIGSDPKKLQ